MEGLTRKVGEKDKETRANLSTSDTLALGNLIDFQTPQGKSTSSVPKCFDLSIK